MQQINATEVCEPYRAKGDRQFSWPFWHPNEPYLLGSFHSDRSRAFYRALDVARTQPSWQLSCRI
jgi:hypothetical protein